MTRNLDYYLRLPYRVILHPSPEGGYAVEIPELPGCLSQGRTVQEALEMIEDAKRCWIADALKRGEEVPEPVDNGSGSRPPESPFAGWRRRP